LAGALADQPDDGAEQHRLAGAGTADDAQNLAGAHIERQAVQDIDAAEAGDEVADADDSLGGGGSHLTNRSRRRRWRSYILKADQSYRLCRKTYLA
ncbi:MAG: hypothetical protein RIS64_4588, partial [Bacteroidota bacterium]